jgi:hypothetical protein
MLKGLHGCFLSLNMAALLPNLASPGRAFVVSKSWVGGKAKSPVVKFLGVLR